MEIKYAPKNKDLHSKRIGYCYPTSPRASYFGAEGIGCYFLTFNGDNAHTGPFASLKDAEEFADSSYPNVKYDYWSLRSEKGMEEFNKRKES